jgi:hypothetical protein
MGHVVIIIYFQNSFLSRWVCGNIFQIFIFVKMGVWEYISKFYFLSKWVCGLFISKIHFVKDGWVHGNLFSKFIFVKDGSAIIIFQNSFVKDDGYVLISFMHKNKLKKFIFIFIF